VKNRLGNIFKHKNFPIFILLFFALVIGLLVFSNFGASWDEPEYYQYADSTIKAYSIKDLINGQYSLESSYGPADLRYYGPAFLIIGKSVIAVLSIFFPHTPSIDLWHLTIYLFYLLGVFFFYQLCLRWTSKKAAIITTLLFYSQPVLFGNAWINPKDIPLLVFFMGTIYFGLRVSDRLKDFFGIWQKKQYENQDLRKPWFKFSGFWDMVYLFFEGFLILFSLIVTIGADFFKKLLAAKILSVNLAVPQTFFEKLFIAFVKNADQVPLSYYANKLSATYDRINTILLVATFFFFILFLTLHRHPHWPKELRLISLHLKDCYNNLPRRRGLIFLFIATSFFLASACATRVIGPLAGLLILLIWILNYQKRSVPVILALGLLSFALFYIQWPYIWKDTFSKLLFVIKHMSNNPVGVNTLFGGVTYDSRYLPVEYFPTLLGITLTETAILFIMVGLVITTFFIVLRFKDHSELLIPLGWFFIPFLYILVKRPPMYDNYRHFLFSLPALFIFCALGVNWLFEKVHNKVFQSVIALILLTPGIIGIFQTHPYEYSYYNSFIGGIRGAENKYDLDYWLTCYKQLGETIEENETKSLDLYVDLNPDLISLYGYPKLKVNSMNVEQYQSGGLIVLPIRWGHSTLFDQYPISYKVEVNGVSLCIARRVK